MKRSVKFILLVLLLSVAITGYLISVSINKKENSADTEADETVIDVISIDTSLIKKVDYCKDGESHIAIDIINSCYSLSSDSHFPIDSDKAETLVSGASQIEAQGSIQNADNLEEYGLDDSKTTLTITLTSGEEKTIIVGDYNRYSDIYYGMIKGENEIFYLVPDFVDLFSLSLDDIILLESVTPPSDGFDDVTKITVSYKNGDTFIYQLVPEVPAEYEDETMVKEAIPAHFDKYDGNGNLIESESEKAEEIYDFVVNTQFTEWIDYDVTEEAELTKYGLFEPEISIKIDFTEEVNSSSDTTSSVVINVDKSILISLGDLLPSEDEEDSERYARIDDGKIIYIVSDEVLSE